MEERQKHVKSSEIWEDWEESVFWTRWDPCIHEITAAAALLQGQGGFHPLAADRHS